MSYLSITLNHFRAVKDWADSCDAQVGLDMRSFAMEIKSRNRYYTLKPRFLTQHDGKMAYTTHLGKDVTGFIGWIPYDILQWDIAQNKLLAKDFFRNAGLKSPAAWHSFEEAKDQFIVKYPVGSFGYQIAGPYQRAQNLFSPPAHESPVAGKVAAFVEQFVGGTNLKVWFWGAKAFYANVHSYPLIVGDGLSQVQTLIESKLAIAGEDFDTSADEGCLMSCLAFQQVHLSDLLQKGQEVWLDFRYGRRYLPKLFRAETDNDLFQINQQVRQQIDLAGEKISSEAMRRFSAPVLFSVDGVIDPEGTVWWLEINSNPMLPPEGYKLMFSSLFGLARKPSA